MLPVLSLNPIVVKYRVDKQSTMMNGTGSSAECVFSPCKIFISWYKLFALVTVILFKQQATSCQNKIPNKRMKIKFDILVTSFPYFFPGISVTNYLEHSAGTKIIFRIYIMNFVAG